MKKFEMVKERDRKFGKGCVFVKKISPREDFENKLADAIDYISSLNIKVYNGEKDGRQVSRANENLVVHPITDKFQWAHTKKQNARDKGDFYIKTVGGYSFPVNAKLLNDSNTQYNNITGTVRTVSKLLYGRELSGYKSFVTEVKKGTQFTTEPQDYAVLVLNKLTGEVDGCSLLNISNNCLSINPSNGLQFKANPLFKVKRTQQVGQQFLFERLIELIKKQAEPYLELIDG